MVGSKKMKMEKICDICGDVGYPERIMTCSQCKKASEHIYCMQSQIYVIPGIWYCEECCTIKTNVPKRHSKLETTEGICSQVKKSRSPVEGSSPICCGENFESISAGEEQIRGTNKPFCTQDIMQEMMTSKGKKDLTAFSPTSEHTMRPLSRSTNFKTLEIPKVKFLPTSEVTKLNSGIKVGDSTLKGSSGGSPHRNCQANAVSARSNELVRRTSQANIMTPSNGLPSRSCQPNVTPSSNGPLNHSCKATAISPPNSRISPSIPKSTRTKAVKGTSLANEESVDAKIYSSPSKRILSVGHASNQMKEKTQKNRVIGEEASEAPCKKGSIEESVTAKACFSPSTSKTSAGSKHDYDATSTPDSNGQRKRSAENAIGTDSCSDAQLEKCAFQDNDFPLILLMDPEGKLPNRHTRKACWNGTFEVFDVVSQAYPGIQAHFPLEVSSKAYEVQKQMSRNLKLKVLSRGDVWPRVFHSDPPTCEDIALYFFPCKDERHREKYFRLMERIELRDSAMQSRVGEVELIIFTSKQLPVDCQRIGAQFYFWGIFRHVKRRKVGQHTEEQSSFPSPASTTQRRTCGQCDVPSEGVCEEAEMEIDMVGGREIGRIDRPVPRFSGPPGFMRPISRDVNHKRRPLVKFELNELACPIISRSPPGSSQPSHFKHGDCSSVPAHESSTLPRKDSGGYVSSYSGEVYATATPQACEMRSKCRQVQHIFLPPPCDNLDGDFDLPELEQVSDHEHKSPAEHSRSNNTSLASEKKKRCDCFDMSYHPTKRDPPQLEAKLHCGHTNLPSLSAKEKLSCSQKKPLHENYTMSGEVFSPSFPSSDKKGDHYSVHSTSINVRDRCQKDTRVQSMSNNLTLMTAREECENSSEESLHESCVQFGEIASNSGTGEETESKITGLEKSVRRRAEGEEETERQSGTDGMLKKKILAPEDSNGKNVGSQSEASLNPHLAFWVSASYDSPSISPECVTKDGIKSKGKPERCGNVEVKDKQQSLVSESFDSPSSSPKQQLILTSGTVLPLFPEESESIEVNAVDLGIEGQDRELKVRCPAPGISSDLSLSRPQYVRDGNVWILAKSRDRLKKDGCGEELRLSTNSF